MNPTGKARETFGQLPRSIIESGLDPTCKAIYACLDYAQGSNTWQLRGISTLAERFGVDPRTLRQHLEHLEAAGVVELIERGSGASHRKTVIKILHRPSRGELSPRLNLPQRASKTESGRSGVPHALRGGEDGLPGRRTVAFSRHTADTEGDRRGADPAPSDARSLHLRQPKRGSTSAPHPESPESEDDESDDEGSVLIDPAKDLVRGRCMSCSETEKWILRLDDGVEIRLCDRHGQLSRDSHPNGRLVDLMDAAAMEEPFIVPPPGATQQAKDHLRAYLDAPEQPEY